MRIIVNNFFDPPLCTSARYYCLRFIRKFSFSYFDVRGSCFIAVALGLHLPVYISITTPCRQRLLIRMGIWTTTLHEIEAIICHVIVMTQHTLTQIHQSCSTFNIFNSTQSAPKSILYLWLHWGFHFLLPFLPHESHKYALVFILPKTMLHIDKVRYNRTWNKQTWAERSRDEKICEEKLKAICVYWRK